MTNPLRMVAVTLSRSEMILMASLLQATSIVGVSPSPAATNEARAMELLQAEHSLRARNAAFINEEGKLMVVRNLLEIVGTCAYPQHSVFVYHTRKDGVASQAFGHQREAIFALHSVLNPELHNLQQFPDASELTTAALRFCDFHATDSTPGLVFDIHRDPLAEARSLADQRQPMEALAVLQKQDIDINAARTLVAMLSQAYTTSVVVVAEYQNERTLTREYTLLQAGNQALLMVPLDEENTRFRLQAIVYDEFFAILQESLSQPMS